MKLQRSMSTKISHWLFKTTANLPCRLIKNDNRPYLERYFVCRVFGITVYLHRFVGADGDRNVHDHPWRFACSLILSGGYLERRVRRFDSAALDGLTLGYRQLSAGRVSFIPSRTFHQIIKTQPETWTLFIHTRRYKGWGFLQPASAGFTYHQPYDTSANLGWETTAPSGRNAGREEQ